MTTERVTHVSYAECREQSAKKWWNDLFSIWQEGPCFDCGHCPQQQGIRPGTPGRRDLHAGTDSHSCCDQLWSQDPDKWVAWSPLPPLLLSALPNPFDIYCPFPFSRWFPGAINKYGVLNYGVMRILEDNQGDDQSDGGAGFCWSSAQPGHQQDCLAGIIIRWVRGICWRHFLNQRLQCTLVAL